jgi:hypothetical protein
MWTLGEGSCFYMDTERGGLCLYGHWEGWSWNHVVTGRGCPGSMWTMGGEVLFHVGIWRGRSWTF